MLGQRHVEALEALRGGGGNDGSGNASAGTGQGAIRMGPQNSPYLPLSEKEAAWKVPLPHAINLPNSIESSLVR